MSSTTFPSPRSDVEYRLHDAGLRWKFKKWMKILESQFFTASLHYDEALSPRRRFDLPLALWYHVFNEDTDGSRCPWLADYILLQVRGSGGARVSSASRAAAAAFAAAPCAMRRTVCSGRSCARYSRRP